MTNRLAQSSSAYLRSAEHQPIEWYEFGEEAFARAKELDRPILLDIGAVWCHWCHVIDRESYEDPDIAKMINDNYVAVKVDRDQRPDIDARYQQVIASMSGQGGWPLTGFLTHDGRVLYGGTYFPPHVMKSLLEKIKAVYIERKAEFLSEPELLSAERARLAEEEKNAMPPEECPPVSAAFYEAMLKAMRNGHDPNHGGFGNQPKFPHFSGLELLIAHAHQTQDPASHQIILKTLDEMARGGVYDQMAGGFHRYSVDKVWHVPHFEKMAYDNAEALKVYSQAYRLTRHPFFKEVTEGIIDWVIETLSDIEKGGFYASQDADINLEDDGDHFTWTLAEVEAILSPEEAAVIVPYYDIHAKGDMHERPGRNVLWVRRTAHQLADKLGMTPEMLLERLSAGKEKLMDARKKRPIPFVDKTLYTNWNGMMLVGFFEAADLLGHPIAKDFALKTLNRLLVDFYKPGEGILHSEGVPGFLDDYAQLAQALLKAYQSTGEQQYLAVVRDLAEQVLAHFEDTREGGFYDARHDDDAPALLKFRRKPIEDSPSSSANAVMIQVLLELYLLTDETRYQDAAERAMRFFATNYGNYGYYVAALGVAVFRWVNPPLKIELLGEENILQAEARQVFSPGKVLAYKTGETEARPEARICIGQRCLTPVHTRDELTAALEQELASVR